jgi:hypothetical protein
MKTILAGLATATLLASPTAVDAKSDLLAADQAFSALSVAKGSNAAYLADDGHVFGTGNQAPIFGKAEAAKRFADPTKGNGDPKTNVLN